MNETSSRMPFILGIIAIIIVIILLVLGGKNEEEAIPVETGEEMQTNVMNQELNPVTFEQTDIVELDTSLQEVLDAAREDEVDLLQELQTTESQALEFVAPEIGLE
jgi:CBS-domain-containing membrane protein